MSDPRLHLSDWTLDQMAEGELPREEQAEAVRHLEGCPACSAQLVAHRSLFAVLAELPRFEPSAGFADAVIARTRLHPEPGLLALWLRRAMPRTRRGWAFLIAALATPALPFIFAALWLLTHPTLTAGGLWDWTRMQAVSSARAGADTLAGWATSSGVMTALAWGHSLLGGVPLSAITALLAVLAIAIPLSAWALFRLVRTPNRNITYAN